MATPYPHILPTECVKESKGPWPKEQIILAIKKASMFDRKMWAMGRMSIGELIYKYA